MKQSDRTRLTNALREHVAKIAADLRVKMRAPGAARDRAAQLHLDERVAEDFEVWTDLLARRAAVLWVLKSVYVRVLEDRGLLTPGRLLDHEAQQLFERLAPHLGETAFLRWVYRDLASRNGGAPELFSPQPAEVALPSDELSRGLIAFWRHRDADTGSHWSFADERFEGELMGDLYQELDPVVKDRFALCQTPDFVRAFILDRTLAPAIETFGADDVRLLDPACGSGHFLIDGLKRLVTATSAAHSDWDRRRVVKHCLARVVGVDLNDYACALARARLVMTAAELAGVGQLSDAGQFHPQVYCADGLEQLERDDVKKPAQIGLFEPSEERPLALLTRPEVRLELKRIFQQKFHAVVANPPYILEQDPDRKKYQRSLVGKRPRYLSAQGKYSLSAPFTERCIQLSVPDGRVGVIIANNFMKRNFGKALIEKVLAEVDLTLVVDTAQAFIPHHATPTVILVISNRAPESPLVRVVAGKRGEAGVPADPATAAVWTSICQGVELPGFENDYISVSDRERRTLAVHSWALEGGQSAEIKARMEARADCRLSALAAEVGYPVVLGEDDAFTAPPSKWFPLWALTVPFVIGTDVRDWGCSTNARVVFPYEAIGSSNLRKLSEHPALAARFLPLRARLEKPYGSTGDSADWYGYVNHSPAKLKAVRKLVFAFVATHNHFALVDEPAAFNRSAPLVILKEADNEPLYFAVLGLLNSSIACFWMKQVFYPKGSKTHDIDKAGTLPENNRFEFAATALRKFPIPSGLHETRVAQIAGRLHTMSRRRAEITPSAVVRTGDALSSAAALREALKRAEAEDESLFGQLVFWQEELDWECYALFGLPREARSGNNEAALAAIPVRPEWRPFAWDGDLPPSAAILPKDVLARYTDRRRLATGNPALSLLEAPVHKRLWRGAQGVFGRYDRTFAEKTRTALQKWLLDRVETAARDRGRPFGREQMVAALQDDPTVLAVCEVLAGRRDFNLSQAIAEALAGSSVPNSRFHLYSESGLVKREAWERTWEQERKRLVGEKSPIDVPPTYGDDDFLQPEHWQLRGKLDVPSERFIAFTEVPGRAGIETLYGWSGWTPLQRLKAILAMDEELDDGGVQLTDRAGLLDSAWRLLADVAREDSAAAIRLKAELQAVLGPDGPSREVVEDWRRRFAVPPARTPKMKHVTVTVDEDGDAEESDDS